MAKRKVVTHRWKRCRRQACVTDPYYGKNHGWCVCRWPRGVMRYRYWLLHARAAEKRGEKVTRG